MACRSEARPRAHASEHMGIADGRDRRVSPHQAFSQSHNSEAGGLRLPASAIITPQTFLLQFGPGEGDGKDAAETSPVGPMGRGGVVELDQV